MPDLFCAADCGADTGHHKPKRKMEGVVVSSEGCRALVERMLQCGGSSSAEAAVVASHLVEANLQGHDSHGVGMLSNYVDQILHGERSSFGCAIVPNEAPTLVIGQDGGPMMVYEAGSSFGQSSARIAMTAAVGRAKEHGICMLGLRNANHIGRVGTYGEIATREGLASIHFVNVYHKLQAPDGGTDQRFGTNPVCLAVPGTASNPGLMLDM